MDTAEKTAANRLMHEQSPYLRQHADNPVDWYPWGDAAFEKAAAEEKPILVSIGYATCHWCHVMADESFSDVQTARVMNRYLVSVKVDREERPDLDEVYIAAVSALTGSAGWPLNVFLTPEAKPFFGGTYFPPAGRIGMPSWTEVVRAVGRAWNDVGEREKLLDSADRITEAVKKHLHAGNGVPGHESLETSLVEKALEDAKSAFSTTYDRRFGGFGPAPKFPMPPILRFLLAYCRYRRLVPGPVEKGTENGDHALEMVRHTLRQMAAGGIYDHVGGGFHRYATDASWHVPHFEKMLYDNAQLIRVYLEAYEIAGEAGFADIARRCLQYVSREMTHPQGGFYSAQDADSVAFDLSAHAEKQAQGEQNAKAHGAEGAFYVWRKAEIDALLDPEAAAVVADYYGVRKNGNAGADPMGEFAGKNILHVSRSIPETAERLGKSTEAVRVLLDNARQRLRVARARRPRPRVDDKILTEWNALMISALAAAFRVLGEETYLDRAVRAIDFINRNLFSETGKLYRRWRDGKAGISAMAGDYAFFVQALLDVYEAGGDPVHLKQAAGLGRQMLDRYEDSEKGGFFTTAPGADRHLLFRVKDVTDGVMPAAGSVAALDCVRLHRLTGENRFDTAAKRTFGAAISHIRQNPQRVPQLLVALVSDLSGTDGFGPGRPRPGGIGGGRRSV